MSSQENQPNEETYRGNPRPHTMGRGNVRYYSDHDMGAVNMADPTPWNIPSWAERLKEFKKTIAPPRTDQPGLTNLAATHQYPDSPGLSSPAMDRSNSTASSFKMEPTQTLDPKAPAFYSTRTPIQQVDSHASPHTFNSQYNLPAGPTTAPVDLYNCAVWVTNLPHDCTYRDLLGNIRNVGKIFSSRIQRAVPPSRRGDAATASARIVFFEPEAAQRMVEYHLVIRGHTAAIRIDSENPAFPHPWMQHRSRVLVITGNRQWANVGYLRAFLQNVYSSTVEYDTDDVFLQDDYWRNEWTVVWRFAGFERGSELAHDAIKWGLSAFVTVDYGRDPCEYRVDYLVV